MPRRFRGGTAQEDGQRRRVLHRAELAPRVRVKLAGQVGSFQKGERLRGGEGERQRVGGGGRGVGGRAFDLRLPVTPALPVRFAPEPDHPGVQLHRPGRERFGESLAQRAHPLAAGVAGMFGVGGVGCLESVLGVPLVEAVRPGEADAVLQPPVGLRLELRAADREELRAVVDGHVVPTSRRGTAPDPAALVEDDNAPPGGVEIARDFESTQARADDENVLDGRFRVQQNSFREPRGIIMRKLSQMHFLRRR